MNTNTKELANIFLLKPENAPKSDDYTYIAPGFIVDYYDFEYRKGMGKFNGINNWGYSMQEKGYLENHFVIYQIYEKI